MSLFFESTYISGGSYNDKFRKQFNQRYSGVAYLAETMNKFLILLKLNAWYTLDVLKNIRNIIKSPLKQIIKLISIELTQICIYGAVLIVFFGVGTR